MRFLFLLLLLSGCAMRQRTGDSYTLADELAGRTAGEARSCIPVRLGQGLVIADLDTLVSRESGTLWVSRLEGRCPGLRPRSSLVIDLHGGQYCRGDRFHTIETGSSVPGPTCVLGDFVPFRARP